MDTVSTEETKRMFECFFIVRMDSAEETTPLFQFPAEGIDNKELRQYEKFCFPFNHSDLTSIGQRHQHFTFMLTDLEKRYKYGFCKLTNGGKLCYCVVSALSWFEIFYKVLNCMCTIHTRNDTDALVSLLNHLYKLPVPKPKEIVTISTSLTFCVPDQSGLPSIPENRNMMEYYSGVSAKTMMEVFAALMFERRIIFTSPSLSILTGCIFAAESLIYPLSWQHIYIPILPPHIIDYCSAPMPFLVGLHSSLYSSLKNTPAIEGVVVVNIESNEVENPYDDLENMPSDVVSYLRSQLGKPNIAVGSNLAGAFLRAQARLIGSYRFALKFRMGEAIVFDEQTFIDMHKPGTKRAFAESLIQLQTFQQFIDKRLDMLNNGIGFRDAFENEITEIQRQDGENQSAVYKEWLTVRKKGGELMYNVKKRAKNNMKSAKESARQSMRDMKNAMKSIDEAQPRPAFRSTRQQSLRENVRSLRPPRPPPPQKGSPNTLPRRGAPARPPPPRSPSVRRYNMIDLSEGSTEDEEELNTLKSLSSSHSQSSLLDEINNDLKNDNKDIPLLIDLSLDSMSTAPTQTKSSNLPTSNVDLLTEELGFNTLPTTSRMRRSPSPNEIPSILPPRRASSIRRAEHVKVRPHRDYNHANQQRPYTVVSTDILGLSFDNHNPSSSSGPRNNWVNFSTENESKRPTAHSGPSQSNGRVKRPVNEPLISFDEF